MEDHVSNGLVAASIDQCSDSSATFDVELGAQTTVSENCAFLQNNITLYEANVRFQPARPF